MAVLNVRFWNNWATIIQGSHYRAVEWRSTALQSPFCIWCGFNNHKHPLMFNHSTALTFCSSDLPVVHTSKTRKGNPFNQTFLRVYIWGGLGTRLAECTQCHAVVFVHFYAGNHSTREKSIAAFSSCETLTVYMTRLYCSSALILHIF